MATDVRPELENKSIQELDGAVSHELDSLGLSQREKLDKQRSTSKRGCASATESEADREVGITP